MVWLVGVVSWRQVESMGVATGCGCKEVYRFPHTTYPYSSCICWNVWVWLVGVVSRRWVWLVGVGGIYGCGYWVWL